MVEEKVEDPCRLLIDALIDGRVAVTFLKMVKEKVEDPRRLLIDA
eukprot:gene25629-11286_t